MDKIVTHWMDDRKLVLTSERREELGSDWQHAYNVPCKIVKGKATPLHKCAHCNGSGKEPTYQYDRCDICGGSGGMPNVEVRGATRLYRGASPRL